MNNKNITPCAVNVASETGTLRAVLLHRPGVEIERMTPLNAAHALYSDILNKPIVDNEYTNFWPEQTEQPEVQNDVVDRNAIFAEARRVAEANARKAQKAIDNEYVRRFGNLKNPETGQPIRSQSDYLAALDAQERMKARAQLQQQGVDPSVLDNAISNALANNPAIRQAEAVMAQAKQEQIFGQIGSEVAVLHEIDPSINTVFDVPPDVVNIVTRSNGAINLVDAYKIANFGKVSQNQQAAIQQQAINQAKGKQHLSPVNGVSTPDEGVDIPESELAIWKEAFPDASKAELRKKYNQTL